MALEDLESGSEVARATAGLLRAPMFAAGCPRPSTTSWCTHRLFERANQVAAELLFQREVFRDVAADFAIAPSSVLDLAALFGGSIHASFRRYVEEHPGCVAGLVLDPEPVVLDPLTLARHEAVASKAWRTRLGPTQRLPRRFSAGEWPLVELARRAQLLRDPCEDDFVMGWPNGDPIRLRVGAVSNSYRIFVLLWTTTSDRGRSRARLAA